MKKILVLGGAGYIGDALVELLLKEGKEVTVYDSLVYEDSYLRKEVDFINASVNNFGKLKKTLDRFECCVNLAAVVGDAACQVDRDETFRTNLSATHFIMDNFEGHLIWPSSCSVYGEQKELAKEHTKTNPLSLYGELKVAIEESLRNYRYDVSILRFGTVYGTTEFARPRFDLIANNMTREAVIDKTITIGSQKQFRPHVHVDDAAAAILHCIEEGVTGLYNIVSENTSIEDLAQIIQDQLAGEVYGPLPIKYKLGTKEDKRDYQADNSMSLEKGFKYSYRLSDGVEEIEYMMSSTPEADWYDPRFSNKDWLELKKKNE